MTFGIAADLVRRALGDPLAVIEDGDPVADAHDDAHVVLDEQDRQARARCGGWLMSRVMSAVSCGFMPAVGSSSSSSTGSLPRARAISRRRWSP